MTKEEFIASIKDIKGISLDEDMKLSFIDDIAANDIETVIKNIIEYEKENDAINVEMKGLTLEVLSNIFKVAFKQSDLRNPTILLNIINLVKSYNTLDESFFNNQKICVSNIEEFLDLKLELKEEIKQFIKQFTIYFLSIIKSYGKVSVGTLDNCIETLPPIYDMIFLSLDIASICNIFQKSEPINTADCIHIMNNEKYMSSFMLKSSMTNLLIQSFFKENSEVNK